jgi:hypothetical protein
LQQINTGVEFLANFLEARNWKAGDH